MSNIALFGDYSHFFCVWNFHVPSRDLEFMKRPINSMCVCVCVCVCVCGGGGGGVNIELNYTVEDPS